ncbi:hypothetical protein [Bradyrhizobium sp. 170]|uniref:hypothetical protein n=1 Tax=Bradyrhizobium sp. 170 TaxID=2782641 RepID=UPI001FFEC8B2|nr:hypothetical protein [Bradyrhizobium sp. 170]UPK05699.1 hypothetical protein IVB05_08895 [Bradyrhizobium sp. 170]
MGKDVDDPMPRDVFQQLSNEQHPHLSEYNMLVEGKTALKGTFQDETKSHSTPHQTPKQSLLHFPTLNEDPEGYLRELRNRSLSFVKAAFSRKAKITQCESRLIGADMEWMVSWASSDDRYGRCRIAPRKALFWSWSDSECHFCELSLLGNAPPYRQRLESAALHFHCCRPGIFFVRLSPGSF